MPSHLPASADLPLEAMDAYEAFDPSFNAVRGDIGLERLAGGCRWAEGPAYFPAGRYVVWSDIPNDRMLRWDEASGAVGTFRSPAGHSNGNAVDRQGRLITCEHSNRRITRTEHDGSITVLADRWDGKRLNSPNDLAVGPDGSIWFTDAAYGIDSDYEGREGHSEIGACHVYRVDPADGAVTVVSDSFSRPTGIGFAPDFSTLYIADSRANHVRALGVSLDGTATADRVVLDGTPGENFDSLAIDVLGRIWVTGGTAVNCVEPTTGDVLGRINLPEYASNAVFGGARRDRLFITASTSLYLITLKVKGASLAYDL